MLAHGRLYVDSEMIVMRACGISEWYVTRVTLLLAIIMAFLCGALTLYAAPLAKETEYQLEERLSAESGLSTLIPGRFQETANKKAVVFVHDVGTQNDQLNKIFLAQHDSEQEKLHIVYAQTGNLTEGLNGAQQLVLSDGVQYEAGQGELDYRVIEFAQYQIQIAEQQPEHQRRKLTAYSTAQLVNDSNLDAVAELQWRIAIPLSLPFLILIAVPLSAVDPRQGRFGKMVPGLLLYLGYFLLLMAGRKVLEQGKIPSELGLWWVHGVMLLIGALLQARNRPFGYKLLARIKGQ
jgi:lipopolysaccharide export system permease protein